MSHIVKSCPLTKLNGGLSRLHSADEDIVWLRRPTHHIYLWQVLCCPYWSLLRFGLEYNAAHSSLSGGRWSLAKSVSPLVVGVA